MNLRHTKLGIGLAVALSVSVSLPAAAETTKLTIVAGHPAIFLWVKHLKESLIPAVDKELAKTGQHKIVWNQAYGGTLAKVGGELEAIEEGLADLGFNPSLFNPAKLPLQNVAYISPFNTDKPRLVTRIIEDMQLKIPAMGKAWEKYNQIYLGGGISIDPYHLWTNFPIRRVEDIKGRKIGAPGAVGNWIKGTGAIAVSSNLTAYYNSIKTGVYDGAIVFATAAAPSKLVEVAPNITRINFGSAYAGGITVNKDTWNKLPAEVKTALRRGVQAYSDGFYAEQAKRIDGSYKMMKAAGAKIFDLPAAERARWASMLPNVAKDWAAKQDEAGRPGRQVLSAFMQALRDKGENPPRAWDKE